jgi:hypothetical protein
MGRVEDTHGGGGRRVHANGGVRVCRVVVAGWLRERKRGARRRHDQLGHEMKDGRVEVSWRGVCVGGEDTTRSNAQPRD